MANHTVDRLYGVVIKNLISRDADSMIFLPFLYLDAANACVIYELAYNLIKKLYGNNTMEQSQTQVYLMKYKTSRFVAEARLLRPGQVTPPLYAHCLFNLSHPKMYALEMSERKSIERYQKMELEVGNIDCVVMCVFRIYGCVWHQNVDEYFREMESVTSERDGKLRLLY